MTIVPLEVVYIFVASPSVTVCTYTRIPFAFAYSVSVCSARSFPLDLHPRHRLPGGVLILRSFAHCKFTPTSVVVLVISLHEILVSFVSLSSVHPQFKLGFNLFSAIIVLFLFPLSLFTCRQSFRSVQGIRLLHTILLVLGACAFICQPTILP